MKLKKDYVFYAFFLCLIIFLYGSLVFSGTDTEYDDDLLLTPLRNLDSFLGYFNLMLEGKIYDFQPIRDLTFGFDIFFEKVTGAKIFHLSNLIYWTIFSLFSLKTIESVHPLKNYQKWAFILLLFIHPIAMVSLSWVSARKHILSCMFIMMATYYSQGYSIEWSLKRKFKIAGLFLLSLLSQPITIFWGVWFLANHYLNKDQWKHVFKDHLSYTLGFITILIAGANTYYYNNIYIKLNQYNKYLGDAFDWNFIVLSLSRHFVQIVAPYNVVMQYDRGNILTILGIILLPVFIYILYKTIERKDLIKWSTFMLIPLLPVLVRETNIFVSDTYLILSLVGFLILSIIGIAERRKALVIFTFIYFVFMGKQYRLPYMFQDTLRLIEHNYKTEPTKLIIKKYADVLKTRGQYRQALSIYKVLITDFPEFVFGHAAFGSALVTAKQVPYVFKISQFESIERPPIVNYFYARLLFENREYDKVIPVMKGSLNSPQYFGMFIHEVYAFFWAACENRPMEKCGPVLNLIKNMKMPKDDLIKIKNYHREFSNAFVDN